MSQVSFQHIKQRARYSAQTVTTMITLLDQRGNMDLITDTSLKKTTQHKITLQKVLLLMPFVINVIAEVAFSMTRVLKNIISI